MQTTITLTSKLGSFTFDKSVVLSRAKLIRDAVTGQFFNPVVPTKIKTEDDAYDFVERHMGRDVEDIPFELHIKVDDN